MKAKRTEHTLKTKWVSSAVTHRYSQFDMKQILTDYGGSGGTMFRVQNQIVSGIRSKQHWLMKSEVKNSDTYKCKNVFG